MPDHAMTPGQQVTLRLKATYRAAADRGFSSFSVGQGDTHVIISLGNATFELEQTWPPGLMNPATDLLGYIDNILKAAYGSARYGLDASVNDEIERLQAIRKDFFGERMPEPTKAGDAPGKED